VSAIRIVKPGLLTTVQDLGRWGHQASGVPVGGPMDVFSHRLANGLVGNDAGAASLEVTLIGPEIEFDADTVIALAGAEFDAWCDGRFVVVGTSVAVRRGEHLRFGKRIRGARTYVAVAGGILTPPVLGSRATHVLTGMGGYEGRPLKAGDTLPTGAGAAQVARRASGLPLPVNGRARVRVLPGPQAEWFSENAMAALTGVGFAVSTRSNRMGYRLEGPPLERLHSEEPISEPVPMGAIQVPSAGQPILLMADRQTAGGYPKIATVIAADLPLAAQLAPGDVIEFQVCTRQDAAAALIARERQLLRVMERTA
jgi:antagonist of KipI